MIPNSKGGGTTTTPPVSYTAPVNQMVQSPMRSTPFTTPVVPKAANPPRTSEKVQVLRTNDKTSQVQNMSIPTQNPTTRHAPATPTAETIPPVHIPTDLMPPIQHYVNTQLEQAARNEEKSQDLTTPAVAQLHDPPAPTHVSEPPVGLEEFPMPDDEAGPPEHTDGIHQESDEGYATVVDDEMASEIDRTAGSRSEGSTTRGTDDQSVGASTNTYDSRQSSRSKSVGHTSIRSDSLDDATDVTASTPPRNNRTDMECDSDDEEAPEDVNLVCPHPEHFKTFWRADFVTFIPTNTNPILAVAVKLGDTLQMLQTIDKDTSVYPYESNPKLKPICDPAAFQSLSTELYSYADKNNLWKYPKKEMKTCRLILCLAMNSDFHST
jgi:hypothetical protein